MKRLIDGREVVATRQGRHAGEIAVVFRPDVPGGSRQVVFMSVLDYRKKVRRVPAKRR